jgi:hypothetical protein
MKKLPDTLTYSLIKRTGPKSAFQMVTPTPSIGNHPTSTVRHMLNQRDLVELAIDAKYQ